MPPAPGFRSIWARAIDGTGQVQTPVQREPYPDGSTGYHVLSVNVVKV